MVEFSVAIALGKSAFLSRDDFRRCSDSDEYPLNLILFLGIPSDSRNYSYYSVDEISFKKKAIYKWLKTTIKYIIFNLCSEKNHFLLFFNVI